MLNRLERFLGFQKFFSFCQSRCRPDLCRSPTECRGYKRVI